MNLQQARRLQQLLAGGLYTAGEDGIRTKEAAVRVAAAQARAIRFALLANDDSEMPAYEDRDDRGWCASNDRFDRNDAFIALGGVVALLDAAHDLCDDVDRAAELIEEIRVAQAEQAELEAAERDLDVLKQAAAQREGGAT